MKGLRDGAEAALEAFAAATSAAAGVLDGKGTIRFASTALRALCGPGPRRLIGRPFADLFERSDVATLEVALRAGGRCSVHLRGSGRTCAVSFSSFAQAWPGASIAVVHAAPRPGPAWRGGGEGSVEDARDGYLTMSGDRRVLGYSRRLLEMSLGATSLQSLLDEACILLQKVLEVELCGALELLPDGSAFVLRAGAGYEPGSVGSARALAGPRSIGGAALASSRALIFEDVRRDPRIDSAPLLERHGAVSGMSVALRGAGRPFGALFGFAREPTTFATEDVELFESTANLLGMALGRQQAIDALQRSEQNFRSLIESAPDAVVVHRDGRILYLNAAALRLLGLTRCEEAVGRRAADFLLPQDQRSFEQLEREVASGVVPGHELRFSRPDGRVVLAENRSLRVSFHGEAAVLTFGREVTERRQMEARLQLADRMASLGTLAAGMAHELNNPLAYVMSNLAYLDAAVAQLEKALPADGKTVALLVEIRAALREASEGAERVQAIVRDLRVFAREEDAIRADVDLRRLAQSAVNMAWSEIRHRARLLKDLQPVPPLEGNSSRLGQVCLNLIVNAAQSISDGDVEGNFIRVATRAAEGHVIFEVQDSGSGIPPEDLKRIFDPFFTTKPPGVGTGLGLSICHNIVASHAGEIQVESVPGKGSTFRVLLPIDGAGAEEEGPRSEKRRTRLLLVQGAPVEGDAVREDLGKTHELLLVGGAREALSMLETGELFDAVVCDLRPGTGIPPDSGLADLEEEMGERMLLVLGPDQEAPPLRRATAARLGDRPVAEAVRELLGARQT